MNQQNMNFDVVPVINLDNLLRTCLKTTNSPVRKKFSLDQTKLKIMLLLQKNVEWIFESLNDYMRDKNFQRLRDIVLSNVAEDLSTPKRTKLMIPYEI